MSSTIKYGKIPPEILEKIIFKKLGSPNENVILGPSIGEDTAIVKTRSNVIALTTDPITGAYKDLGRLVVNINANDIATRGMKPVFLLVTLLLPKDFDETKLSVIVNQMDQEAKKLGITIVGGHTEYTPEIKNPIAVGFMLGEVIFDRFVTSGGAKPGDVLIMTKAAGIEGTAILAEDCEDLLKKRGLTNEELTFAKKLKEQTSVVKDGLLAMETGKVHAMHDPTEGGILGGIYEMAEASKLGIKVYKEKMKFYSVTLKMAKVLDIDPYYLISSGSMLIATSEKNAEYIISKLKSEGIDATVIGKFVKSDERVVIDESGKTRKIDWPKEDELWRALEACSAK
ncbi:MAG: AIR synthase family protein [Candidatus Asgardarchaeia archaeon]